MSKHSPTSLFEIENFRSYLTSWIKTKGRGESRRIATSLAMHTTLISQVLNGHKCLTEEQTSRLCKYMCLSNLETDYFLKLIQIERAGSEDLRNLYKRHLKQIRLQADEVRSHVPESRELSEQDRAIFYSSWQYSLIRLLTSIDKNQTVEALSLRLELPISRVQNIINFLVSRGLCKHTQGKIIRTDKNTHVEAQSSLSTRHHQNWRSKSLSLLESMTLDDLAFTAPIALSKKDISKVRAILLNTISDIGKLVEKSPSEDVAYLGIDWIKI